MSVNGQRYASGYFRREGDGASEQLIALPVALSGWATDHLRGSAVAGALARSAEVAGRARPDLRPARFTVDLHGAASTAGATTESTVVREGRRLMLVDTEFVQGGRPVARARTLFLSAASEEHAALEPWEPDAFPGVPPDDLVPLTEEGRLFYSDGVGWTAKAHPHQGSERKQLWCDAIPVVEGEVATAFQAAGSIADFTNLVTHWGPGGVRHINADITLVLARLPRLGPLGLSATSRARSGGLSVGTAEIYDSEGIFGYTTVSTILQSVRSVDTVSLLMRSVSTTSAVTDQESQQC